ERHESVDKGYIRKYVQVYCFFSSRRRHTRFSRDWSSDVCSSDLKGNRSAEARTKMNEEMMALYKEHGVNPVSGCFPLLAQFPVLIGRASCRERVQTGVAAA